MSKDSQNVFIKLISKTILDKILNEPKKARYYSIVADTALNSNRQEIFSIFIRYVDENIISIEKLTSI